MDKEQAARDIKQTLLICARLYTGMIDSALMNEVINECSRFVYQKFKNIGVLEIREAFSMAAANFFEKIELRAYYGNFTVAMLGDILSAYTEYRNVVISKMEKAEEKEKEALKLLEAEKKNEETRKQICEEIMYAIRAANEGLPIWEHWEHIPVHYSEIAIKSGIIEFSGEKKREIWELAKAEAKKELIEISQDHNRFLEAKSAKDVLKILVQGLEHNRHKDMAVRIYSKMLLWEFVKPK